MATYTSEQTTSLLAKCEKWLAQLTTDIRELTELTQPISPDNAIAA